MGTEDVTDERQFTVVGLWWETLERFAEHYTAGSAQMAEELAQMHAHEVLGHLMVAAVFEGHLLSADGYARWADPDCRTQEQQDQARRELEDGA